MPFATIATARPAPQRHAAACGMTIMELSLAVVVLSVALLTAVGQIANLRSARDQAKDKVAVHAVVAALAERFQGARWDTLGATTAPWSVARPEPNAGFTATSPALADDSDIRAFDLNGDGTVAAAELAQGRQEHGLQTLGVIAEPIGVADLRIHIEYYRAMALRDVDGNLVPGSPGMMDGEDVAYANAQAFTDRFRFDLRQESLPAATRAAVLANRALYRLDPTQPPIGQVGENQPIVIRILATWSERVGGELLPAGQLAILTTRKP